MTNYFFQAKAFLKHGSLVFGLLLATGTLRAGVQPNSLFSDNAVLQQGQTVPVWGTADEGKNIRVEFAGQSVATVSKNGKWIAHLAPMKAGGPFNLKISDGRESLTLTNILVGDVWLASGQSNMQDPLGPCWWAAPIEHWQAEVAAADYPRIRQFFVPMTVAYHSETDTHGSWAVSSPQTAPGFSAAGYFFARDLQATTKTPVGILFSAWGGTVAEAWTSAGALQSMPDFTNALAGIREVDPNAYSRQLAEWYRTNDPGSAAQPAWSGASLDTTGWKPMKLPTHWQHADLPGFNGIVWFRKEINLPDAWEGKSARLHLDTIDDQDTTWVNGVQVGASSSFADVRNYVVPAGVLKPGRNVIAIRVLDTGGLGGICGKAEQMKLELPGEDAVAAVDLAGEWQYQRTTSLSKLGAIPANPAGNPNVVTVLYNAMIAPLQPFPIKGVIWYQGESNDNTEQRARQYRTLFPLLIKDWRQNWGLGDFPFLFVQIAPYSQMTPEIREAQLLTLQRATHTAMVVLTDAGDANNIHPASKQVVGERLALAARAMAYGEKIEYSGPVYQSMKIKGQKVILRFAHARSGLLAKDGPLKGFTIAGEDKKFAPAEAIIKGNMLEVTSGAVARPLAVRYGWSNVPEVNLYNQAGLPASPFRTDVD